MNEVRTADQRRDVLRAVGPVGWVLLEELTSRAGDTVDDPCTVITSVQQLGNAIGVGRDAVTRALTRLRRAGLVTVESERDASGRFVASRYTFAPRGDVIVQSRGLDAAKRRTRAATAAGSSANGEAAIGEHGDDATHRPSSRQRANKTPTRTASPRDNQLSLLNPDPA